MDLRSVANVARQLPFHDAWNRGHRQAANLLNPSLAIDAALESSHELAQGLQHVMSSMLCGCGRVGLCPMWECCSCLSGAWCLCGEVI